jgi:hypothetical protein
MNTVKESRATTLVWRLAFLVPIAVAIGLQVFSHREPDLHRSIRLSICGNVFLSVALIAQSMYLMRKT